MALHPPLLWLSARRSLLFSLSTLVALGSCRLSVLVEAPGIAGGVSFENSPPVQPSPFQNYGNRRPPQVPSEDSRVPAFDRAATAADGAFVIQVQTSMRKCLFRRADPTGLRGRLNPPG